MASLDARLEKLEQRRQQEAGEEILRRVGCASNDALARFLLGLELAPEGEPFETTEARAWACLGSSRAQAHLAGQQDGWPEKLGAQLARRQGLREYMLEKYPAATLHAYPRLQGVAQPAGESA